jgi:hypothetical protein
VIINILTDMNQKCLLPFKKGAYRLLIGFLFILAFSFSACEPGAHETSPSQDRATTSENNIRVLRSPSNKLVNKLLLTDPRGESQQLDGLKSKINAMISGYNAQRTTSAASVYYMDLKSGAWFAINGNEPYTPGSLIKLPVCMSFFKLDEKSPGVMDRKIFFDPSMQGVPSQTFEVDPIKPGQSYSMSELIRRVLKDSDNYSTSLINYQIDYESLHKLYRELDQPIPDMHDLSYTSNVIDYSKFLHVLYNGTWLNERNSEAVLSLLAESSFNEGLTKLLPKDILVPRKFGEYGMQEIKQWHESGIVYAPNGHYLVTIMTKGYNRDNLRSVISELSKAIYEGR